MDSREAATGDKNGAAGRKSLGTQPTVVNIDEPRNAEDDRLIIPSIPKPLAYGLYFAIRLGYEFSPEFCLAPGLLDGLYGPPDGRVRVCHPLESVQLGKEAAGDLNQQIALSIGVDAAWVDGFCDSLNGIDSHAGGAYRDGYCLSRWPELRRWIDPLVAAPTSLRSSKGDPEKITGAARPQSPESRFHRGLK